jgi:F-type H+-transporting ATPase subunit a
VVLAELLPNVNELFEWKGFIGEHTWYEVNKTVVLAFVSTLICIVLFFVGSRKRKLVPTGLQNAAELGYETVEGQIAVEVMGEDAGRKWAPFLDTLFFWIFFINIWST